MDLKTLEHNHEIKNLEISEFESNLGQFLSEIKELENIIATSHKTLLEKLLEIVSFGFIGYDKKYDEITNKHTKKISQLKAICKSIKEKLATSKKEANQLQELFNIELNRFKNNVVQFQSKLLNLAINNYINDYTRRKLKVKLEQITAGNEKYLSHKNIQPLIKELIGFLQNSCEWVKTKNIIFIKNEKIIEKSFFDSIESNPLTEKQKDAVLVNENNNLILAGAGSGKTSVIVAKVAYLIKKNILHPNEILILAFNKNAQEELSERFNEKNLHVKIKTFHSFGLSVIAEAMAQKPDWSVNTISYLDHFQFEQFYST